MVTGTLAAFSNQNPLPLVNDVTDGKVIIWEGVEPANCRNFPKDPGAKVTEVVYWTTLLPSAPNGVEKRKFN
jgi:hypothetical protein